LRDYQRDAVEACISESRGIVQAPTGSGKTEVIAALGAEVPCKWLVLVHRKTLVNQAAERFEKRTGLEEFIYESGMEWREHDMCFTTFQTLHSRLQQNDQTAWQLIKEAEGLIVDECHVLPADTFYKTAMAADNAYYRIGLSGTPLARGDKRSLMAIAALGNVIYRISAEELIEAGVLAVPKIEMVEVEHTFEEKPTFRGAYGEGIIRSGKRNRAVIDCAKRAQKPCLLFVTQIAHGKALKDKLEKEGLKVEFVWGNEPEARRMAAIRRLEHLDTEVLISSVVMQEGVDIPSLRSVVIASGGKSVIATLQRIGRGMRTDGGKKSEFQVFDFVDHGDKWLYKHSLARMRAYKREGYTVSSK
jgi:superfamily II DNA or RNA helicase